MRSGNEDGDGQMVSRSLEGGVSFEIFDARLLFHCGLDDVTSVN